ncbi:hypothetical protein [Halomonas mongoliensis]|uniref:hypothetical protein n=1 Tax=Halomonas mongoliensis TaxID=321265 RepID=UPI00403AC9C7
MIKVCGPVDEPDGFDEECRKKGLRWLEDNPDKERPRDYWTRFRDDLANAFSCRCGFGAMYITSGTVDHHVSCHENRMLSYEWSNFRYVEGWMNSSKNKVSHADILDPFEVNNDWFEIDLPSLQLKLTDKIPEEYLERAKYTLKRLPLQHDERVIKQRRAWYELYEAGDLSLKGLRKMAPLIAKAVEKK